MMDSMLMTTLENMKSSRRKQSKPIRVFGDLPQGSPFIPPSAPQQELLTEMSDPEIENDDAPQDDEINACDKCPETFPSAEALTAHVSNFHCAEDVPPKVDSFPTKYHQLGNELNKDNVFLANGDDSKLMMHDANRNNVDYVGRYSNDREEPSAFVRRPLFDDKLDSSYEEGLLPISEATYKSDGTRIFHQDAYCALCDREFCNKYFLKTHKANKHAIYDGVYPLAGTKSPENKSNNVSPTLPTSAPFTSPISIPVIPMSTTSTSSLDIFNINSTKNMSKGLDVEPPPLLSMVSNLTTPQKSEASSAPSTPAMTPSEMEDYCEICQKHFCNKYYLKRHKQDVHGIAPDTPTMSRRRPIVDSLPSMVPSSTTSPLILPQSMNNLNNVMVLNPFVPPVAILQAPPFMQSQGLPIMPQMPMSSLPMSSLPMSSMTMSSLPMTSLPMTSLPMTSLPMTSLPMTSLPMTSQPEQPIAIAMAPSPTTIPNDSLRNIGVLNAEAYCDICRKEFCNKYFLRIHKANKHGIFTEDCPGPFNTSIPPPGLPESFYRYAGSTDPAQALVASIFKATIKLESENAELNNQNKQNTPVIDTNSFCNICNSEFSSKYSYKIHRMSVHGILTDDSADDKLEPGQVAVYSSSQFVESGNTPSNSEPIKCEICYRQLSGKHALKHHMNKHHKSTLYPEIKPDISKIKVEKSESTFSDVNSQKDPKEDNQIDMDKPQDKDLSKLPVDPDIHCEICKKEFCSKFFLMTHMLNVHGLKSPSNGERMQKSPASPVVSSAVGTLQRLAEANALNVNNTSPLNLSNNSLDYDSYSDSKQAWRWKEPANSARVTCDICNRELCNKYFLRTHKFNKHGIAFENQKSSVNSRTSPNSVDALKSTTNGTPTTPKLATIRPAPAAPPNLVMDERRSQTIQKLTESLKTKSMEEDAYNIYTDVCNFCSKRFCNAVSLQSHLVKEHSLLQTPNYSIDRMLYASLPPSNFDFKLTPKEGCLCNLCKKTFVDTLALQLHLIQEHHAQVQLQPETPSQGLDLSNHNLKPKSKLKLYSCSHCDYKSKWLPNIYSHEEKKHNITKASRSTFQCSMCTKTFLYEHSLIRHLRDYHQQNKKNIGEDTDLKASKVKNFKCTRCKNNFPTLFDCIKHIRLDHIRRDKNSNQKMAPLSHTRKLFCRKCSFTTRFPKILRNHTMQYHQPRKSFSAPKSPVTSDSSVCSSGGIGPVCHASPVRTAPDYEMQPFTLQAEKQDETFVESTVHLPVRAPVKTPVTVTFTLIPMQH